MRAQGYFLIAGLVLAGCVPATPYYVKNGVTFDRYERDGVSCATAATQAVPSNTQVGWIPYVGIVSADTNGALRDKNMEFCMRDRGYQRIGIPLCEGAKATAARKQAALIRSDRSRRMAISAQSCHVILGDGTTFLYTP